MTEMNLPRVGLSALLLIPLACAAALGANRVVTPPSHEVILDTASQIASRAKGTPDEQARLEKTILGKRPVFRTLTLVLKNLRRGDLAEILLRLFLV